MCENNYECISNFCFNKACSNSEEVLSESSFFERGLIRLSCFFKSGEAKASCLIKTMEKWGLLS